MLTEAQAPKLSTPREIINVPAVEAPHAGASYNPPLEAHQDLLLVAYKVEQQRIAEAEKYVAPTASPPSPSPLSG